MENNYTLLGVGENANREELQQAYRKKLKIYHPDLYFGDKLEAERITAKYMKKIIAN